MKNATNNYSKRLSISRIRKRKKLQIIRINWSRRNRRWSRDSYPRSKMKTGKCSIESKTFKPHTTSKNSNNHGSSRSGSYTSNVNIRLSSQSKILRAKINWVSLNHFAIRIWATDSHSTNHHRGKIWSSHHSDSLTKLFRRVVAIYSLRLWSSWMTKKLKIWLGLELLCRLYPQSPKMFRSQFSKRMEAQHF